MNKIKQWLVNFQQSEFGLMFDAAEVPSKIRNKYDIVILCTNDGTGLKPFRLLLPHQVYKKDLQEVIANYASESGRPLDSIFAIPASSEDYYPIWSASGPYG